MTSGDFDFRIFDSLPGHAAVVDDKGTITAVNAAWRRFAVESGNPPSKSVGEGANYFDVLRAVAGKEQAEALAVLNGMQRVLSGSLPEYTHESACHSPSERRWFLMRVAPLSGGGGLLVCHENVTGRALLEERLAEEKQTADTLNRIGKIVGAELDLRTLVQSVTDETTRLTSARFGAFFYTDKTETGEALTLYTLSGAPREAFSRFPIPRNTELFGPTFRGEAAVRLDDVTKDRRYGTNAPYHGMPEGHLPVRSYLAVPVISRHGEVLGGLFFGHSEAGVFTERHERLAVGVAAQAAIAIENARLYEQARQALRAKDEFLAVMSHELRTPLNAISGWTQILERGGLPTEDVTHGLGVIRRSVRSQTQIISDLLDVSRIATGKLSLELVPTDPLAAVQAAVESVRFSAEAKSLRLEFVSACSGGPVLADPVRLQQVVSNLLNNSIKFTPEGGRVEVRVERAGGCLRIAVSDTGKGIAPEFLPQVFERFRQADDRVSKRQHGGFGLGLAIARHLVELHKGTVRAESPGEGKGATFTVELPLIVPDSASAASTGQAAARTEERLDGLKLLAVDDEADSRELAVRALAGQGAEVRAAGSANEAIAVLREWKPDVIVSDLGMPERDGYDLIRDIRALERGSGEHVPVVALSAFAGPEDRDRCLAAGFERHLSKPVVDDVLVHTVSEIARAAK